MATRILHCSTSIENYNLCIQEGVAGFIYRGPKSEDLIYLVVKANGVSYCGARFKLDEPTDNKPWQDADSYINVLTIKDVEYCKPFDISFLKKSGGNYWALKYVQGAKEIKDGEAIRLLDEAFQLRLTQDFVSLIETPKKKSKNKVIEKVADLDYSPTEQLSIDNEIDYEKVIHEIPESKIEIMGTFQTIQFSNETDKMKGLERLVNENFYHLFPQFPEKNSILIPENRIFLTQGFNVEGSNVQGIRSIPDGILIQYTKKEKKPFRINIIEYECYGEKKVRSVDKSNYMNTTIIPQLMRFASAFSIITDNTTRNTTIETWVDKIINFVNKDDVLSKKFISWIKELYPQIRERSLEREMEKLLIDAFKTNIRVLLVIDELSPEQKATIKNVVSSFRLADGNDNVQFEGYVVRLVQKINHLNNESEFALTVQ